MNRSRLKLGALILFLAFLIAHPASTAAEPTVSGLVTMSKTSQGGGPMNLTASGDYLYFTADDGIHGRELWRLDREGKAALVIDFVAGPLDGNLETIYDGGDMLYFGAGGTFRTRGTPGSTVFVGEQPGSYERGLNLGNLHYFTGKNPPGAPQFWVSDGSQSGTHNLHVPNGNLATIYGGNRPPMARFQDKIYVPVADRNHNTISLYYATADATNLQPVLDPDGIQVPRSISGETTWICVVEDTLYFTGRNAEGRNEIWVTKGTPESTRRVYVFPSEESLAINGIARAGSIAIIQITTRDLGDELWRSDGTTEGTFLLKDIVPGPTGSSPYQFWPIGESSVFIADHPDFGSELWITNGYPEGTQLLKDLVAGPRGSDPYQLLNYKNWVLFSCENYEYGEELWRTDGTPEGTVMIKDINPGIADSEPYHLCKFNDKVYFTATHPAYGQELWESDGSAEGTRLAARIRPQARVVGSSYPRHLTAFRNQLYFTAIARDGLRSLFRSAGASDTTVPVLPQLGEDGNHVVDLLTRDDVLYVTTENAEGQERYWKSDASSENTVTIVKLPEVDMTSPFEQILLPDDYQRLVPSPLPANRWATLGNSTYFAAYRPETGTELWVVEHETRQVSLFLDIMAGPASASPDSLTAMGDRIVFIAEDNNKGKELWLTDGTPAGTRLVMDFNVFPLSGSPNFVIDSEERLYFLTQSSDSIPQLHRLNPPKYNEPTDLLVNWNSQAFSEIAQLSIAGDTIYFTATHTASGNELWRVTDWESGAPPKESAARIHLVRDIGLDQVFEPLENRWVADYLAD